MENIEQNYLQKIFEKQLPVTVFLTCNVKLQGTIKAFDEHGFLLNHEGRLQFVYKHAISTISVGNALKEEELV